MKKLFSIIAIAMLIATMIPSMAFAGVQDSCAQTHCAHEAAIGGTHYDTLNEAASAADTGQTVTLLKNVSISSDISFKKSVTLDLNNKKITGTNKSIKLEDGGKITQGNLENCYVSIGNVMNKTTGNLEYVEMNCISTSIAGITVYGSDVTINNCKINNTAKNNYSGAIAAKYAMAQNTSIKLIDTKIVQSTDSQLTTANVIYVGANLNNLQISIENCDIKLVSDKSAAFNLSKGTTLTIGDNTKLNATKEDGSDGLFFIKNQTGNAEVNGGTFDGDLLRLNSETEFKDNVLINGGKFKISEANNKDLDIIGAGYKDAQGGQYYDIIPSNYVAKVGDTYYEDITEALTAAKASSDKTIYIIKEVNLTLDNIHGLNISSEGRRAVVNIDASLDDVLSKCTFTALREIKVVDNSETYTIKDVTTSEEGIKSGKITRNILDNLKILDKKYIDSNSIYYTRNSEDYVTVGLLSDLPQVVALVDNKGFVTLGEAVTSVSFNDRNNKDKETITLVKDFSTDYPITTSYPKSAFTLDLNGCTLEFNGASDDAIAITLLSSDLSQNASDADITIKNGRIISNGTGSVISVNGLLENTNLKIENVKIDAPNGAGLYLASKGNTTLKNVDINAKLVGVQTCANHVTMKNCNITANGDNQAANKTNGDGLIPDGSAVSVVNREGYLDVPKVVIESGEYKALEGIPAINGYSWNYNLQNPEDSVRDWNGEANALEINGGIFSSDPFEYLGDGKNREKLYDDNFIVGKDVVVENGKIVSGEFNEQDITEYVATGSVEKAADGTIVIKKAEASTKTGDNANIALWIALMATAAVGGAGTVLYRRKRNA